MKKKEDIMRAFRDADCAFAVTQFWDEKIIRNPELEVKEGKNIADAAHQNQVQHFVFRYLQFLKLFPQFLFSPIFEDHTLYCGDLSPLCDAISISIHSDQDPYFPYIFIVHWTMLMTFQRAATPKCTDLTTKRRSPSTLNKSIFLTLGLFGILCTKYEES